MNICPFKFETFDENNLSYEIQFLSPYGIDYLKKTIIKDSYENFFIKKDFDERQVDKLWANETAKGNHRFLLKAGWAGERNQMEVLMETVDKARTAYLARCERYRQRLSDSPDMAGDGDAKQSAHGTGNREEELLDIEITEKPAGTKTYSIEVDGVEVMKAYPCCPRCNTMLPLEWFKAEDFCGISMLALIKGGKSTMSLSIIGNNFERLWMPGDGIVFSPAQEKSTDVFYEEACRNAERMIRDKLYPVGTPKMYVHPVFLNMDYKGHRMVIGLYDVSGEIMMEANSMNSLVSHLKYMSAHIYLIEPKDMKVTLEDTKSKEEAIKECRILDIDAQGELQKKNRGKTVAASGLVKTQKHTQTEKRNKDLFSLFVKVVNLLNDSGNGEEIRKGQHMAFSIIKSDLLETAPEIKDLYHDLLFERPECWELWDDDRNLMRMEVVRKVFDQCIMDRAMMDRLAARFGTVSWHCVSATGCAGERELDGEYNPIRVEEPFIECIRAKIKKNKWDDEE